MAVVGEKKAFFGIEPICRALGLARATYYRLQTARAARRTERDHPRALSSEKRHTVLGVLNEERFCDQAPAEVYASLLDEGKYLCSQRTCTVS